MSRHNTPNRPASTTSYPPASPEYLAAIPRLHDLGLPLLPIRPGEKRPAWCRFLKHHHTEREYRDKLLPHVQAGGLLGFSPGLSRLAILDVDAGDPDALAELLPPLETLPSCRPGRGHLLYPDTEAVAVAYSGRKWEYGSSPDGWAGEVISSRHYVVIYARCW